MAISFGAGNAQQGGEDTTVSVALTGVTTGDLIVVFGCSDVAGAGTPFTSTPSETWTVHQSSADFQFVYMASTIATSTDDYTITYNLGSNGFPSVFAVRVGGNWGSSRLVDTAINQASASTAVTTADMDTTAPSFLILGHTDQFTGGNETVAPQMDWTEITDLDDDGNNKPIRGSYRVLSTSGANAISSTYSGNVNWRAISCAFQEEVVEGVTNMQINIADTWRAISGASINIGDTWQSADAMQINIGDAWETIF